MFTRYIYEYRRVCRGIGRRKRQRMARGHLLRRKRSSVWSEPSMPTCVRGPVHAARISSRQVNKRRESYVQHANVRSKKGKDPGRSSPGYVSRTHAGEQEQRKSNRSIAYLDPSLKKLLLLPTVLSLYLYVLAVLLRY